MLGDKACSSSDSRLASRQGMNQTRYHRHRRLRTIAQSCQDLVLLQPADTQGLATFVCRQLPLNNVCNPLCSNWAAGCTWVPDRHACGCRLPMPAGYSVGVEGRENAVDAGSQVRKGKRCGGNSGWTAGSTPSWAEASSDTPIMLFHVEAVTASAAAATIPGATNHDEAAAEIA
ncbi:hypothetical protein VaNZ11_003364, partial [Volvox africanus]